MRSDWKEVRLGDVIEFVVDNRGKTPPTCENSGYELLEVNAISATLKAPQYGEIRKYVAKATYENWFRKGHPKVGDVLVPTVGTLGAVSYMRENRGSIAQNLIALRTDAKYCNGDFLYYVLRNPKTRQRLLNLDIGGVQPSIKVPHLLNLRIAIPDTTEQRAIAATLSCLDDKIELNNKINANLEAQAQAIFKSWFVDFEPFQDDGFVDSEMGMIPKGWRVGTLSELVSVKYGKDHKKLADGAIPVYGSGGIMRYAEKALYQGESVLIPRKGTLNNVIYSNEPFWTVDTMFYTEMLRPYIAKFIYFFINSKDLASMNAGSAVPSMTTDILNNLQVVIAPDTVFQEYDILVSQMFDMKRYNTKQSRTLAAIRDALLPKLMSGEIEVPLEG